MPVSWWEPRWSFVPPAVRALRTTFSRPACLRILLASAVAALASFVIVEFFVRPAMPALQFNWLKGFAIGIGLVAILIGYLACVQIGLPRRITVSTKGILRQTGQHVEFLKRDDIHAIHLVLRRDGRHFIRAETAKRSMRIGLAKKLSMLALEKHLGDRAIVHDHRGPLSADQPRRTERRLYSGPAGARPIE